eukprot:NODE_2777_length_1093_cov_1198.213251_g2584_i3.p1 GENE.NODE_2777_length_1093_cov_1198.213251_g2584_i3~~NODE_2777_length_1093_cov_1198.213251_g2584_i3.p1  ORF type:complete len:302 (-),score=66.31 NODE_2777_length_1093_cov_1198.213251_g2584_i3:101-1006(-)
MDHLAPQDPSPSDIEHKIIELEQKITAVEKKLQNPLTRETYETEAYLVDKEKQLRDEKKLLRDEKKLLLQLQLKSAVQPSQGNEDMLAGAIRVMFATKELADRGVTTISRNRAFHGRVAEYYHFHFCFVSGQRPSQGQNRVEAAHILPLTLIGALEFENTDQLTDINDPRNGLLLTHDIHADFDHHYVYFEVDSSRPRDVRIYFRVITATVGGPSPTSRRFDGQRIAFEQHRLPALHLLQRHAKLAQQRQFQFQASGLLRLQLPPDDEPEGPRALCADEMAAYESRRLGAISKCWGKLLRA